MKSVLINYVCLLLDYINLENNYVFLKPTSPLIYIEWKDLLSSTLFYLSIEYYRLHDSEFIAHSH